MVHIMYEDEKGEFHLTTVLLTVEDPERLKDIYWVRKELKDKSVVLLVGVAAPVVSYGQVVGEEDAIVDIIPDDEPLYKVFMEGTKVIVEYTENANSIPEFI